MGRPRIHVLTIVIYIKTVFANVSPFAVVATQDGSLNPMFLFSVDYSNDTWWTNLMRKYPVQPQVVVSGYFSSRLRL